MSLRDAIAALPDDAMVPVGWIREQLGAGDDRLADLTVEEAAAELGRAPSTVRGWLGSGELRGYRLNGREWRVPRAAVHDYLERQKNGNRQVTKANGKAADLSAWKNVKT